ncbi:unnamed protein product, partial [Mesorhabditis belari]|uniref:Uncharacterized protein n=1 Tax=Mesorhabditis belari TaxID=2138241 RepID=A0AAF3J3S7_9BILA
MLGFVTSMAQAGGLVAKTQADIERSITTALAIAQQLANDVDTFAAVAEAITPFIQIFLFSLSLFLLFATCRIFANGVIAFLVWKSDRKQEEERFSEATTRAVSEHFQYDFTPIGDDVMKKREIEASPC